MEQVEFQGFRRPDGRFGVRNHVLVLSTVCCANGVVANIGAAVPEVKAITHTEGCGRGFGDMDIAWRTLVGLGRNPNVAAVLVVGLGCEFLKAPEVAEAIRRSGKRVECVVIHDAGGSRKAQQAGIEIARQLVAEARTQEREPAPLGQLVVGLECGGSDALSGVTSNAVVGRVADWLVDSGATVILAETTEMIGTEHILARRAATPELASRILQLVEAQRVLAAQLLGEFAGRVISPGNESGGLTSITEKSLGCIAKAGRSPIGELVDYAGAPTHRGLVIMDTPGSDIFQLTGMAAGGATLTLFTTGMGTPAGSPVMPVVKISSNSETYRRMEDDIDLDAGPVLTESSVDEVSERLMAIVRRVIDGEETRAEINRQDLLAIHTRGPSF